VSRFERLKSDPRWQEIQKIARELWSEGKLIRRTALELFGWEIEELTGEPHLTREYLRDFLFVPETALDAAERYVETARGNDADIVLVEAAIRGISMSTDPRFQKLPSATDELVAEVIRTRQWKEGNTYWDKIGVVN
jgi:hypothetical protein